jgi:hypothetical protein
MFLEVNENENTTYQILWDTAKPVLIGKFIVMSAYIQRTERSQIDDLMLRLQLRKRKSKTIESNLNLGTHNQTFKQLRQLNDRNHHIPISTNA